MSDQEGVAPALLLEARLLRRQIHDLITFFPAALIEVRLAPPGFTYMNRVALILFGYAENEVSRLEPRDLFDAGEFERASEVVQSHVFRGGVPYRRSNELDVYAFRLRRKDGSVFAAEVQTAFVLDVSGQPSLLRVVVRDVQEQVAAVSQRDARIHELEARLAELEARPPRVCRYCGRVLDSGNHAAEHAPGAPEPRQGRRHGKRQRAR